MTASSPQFFVKNDEEKPPQGLVPTAVLIQYKFVGFLLAIGGTIVYNNSETQKHKGRAHRMAVPCAPMQEPR